MMSRYLEFTRTRWGVSLLILSCIAFSLTGCSEEAKAEHAPPNQWFEIQLGDKNIDVQIAYKQAEMAKGLMHRTSMGDNQGMIFFYDPPKQMSFWMRNTKIALDIGFFTSDGILSEVYPMYPMDETSVKSRRNDLLIALEMNLGWFAKNGIKPGDSFNLEMLKNALLKRGVQESKITF